MTESQIFSRPVRLNSVNKNFIIYWSLYVLSSRGSRRALYGPVHALRVIRAFLSNVFR